MCKASHINPPKINQTNLSTYALAMHPLRTGPSPIAYKQAVQLKTASFNRSFTAASLRPQLARIIAEMYLQEGNWPAAKARVLASNAHAQPQGALQAALVIARPLSSATKAASFVSNASTTAIRS